ncbi:odorant receptor Or1 isoform X2 [Cylas formicarius]|uniref:odorant receptor Or1 isoform X2 n=1 Tax=Cylas formicarius TaxID=197179 RepID=UPI002958391D|nr:odorant receptor Or1 isoform X2 [Cylas formicarius]
MTSPTEHDLTQVYRMEKRLMLLAGFYPKPKDSNQFVYYLSCAVVFSIEVYFELSMTLYVVNEMDDVMKIAETLLFLMTQTAFLAKLINFAYNKDKLSVLEAILKTELFQEMTRTDFQKFQANVSKSRKILLFYCSNAAASVSGYVLIPFFEGRSTHRNLDYSLPPGIVRRQLKRNALFHLEILKVANLTERFFTYGILVQFLSSIFVICFTGFQMMLIPTLSSDFFHFVVYLACMLSQVAIFCCYGHFVTNESSDIGEAIYLSNWYMSDLSVRKDLLIVMENTKKPILLTAGKFLPLVMSTLTAILRSSYSFLAVLQQME